MQQFSLSQQLFLRYYQISYLLSQTLSSTTTAHPWSLLYGTGYETPKILLPIQKIYNNNVNVFSFETMKQLIIVASQNTFYTHTFHSHLIPETGIINFTNDQDKNLLSIYTLHCNTDMIM